MNFQAGKAEKTASCYRLSSHHHRNNRSPFTLKSMPSLHLLQ